jgi:hypothetical protein
VGGRPRLGRSGKVMAMVPGSRGSTMRFLLWAGILLS